MGEKIYYYTDFNTFKLILENGTLRFKESTKSNDHLDTIKIFEGMNEYKDTKIKPLGDEDTTVLQFAGNCLKCLPNDMSQKYLVACFTKKKDSRLLWDAYTMNRKDRKSEAYNGVCIEFDVEKLNDRLHEADIECDTKYIKTVKYGKEEINSFLDEEYGKYLEEYKFLKDDRDQQQNIIQTIVLENVQIDFKKSVVYPLFKLYCTILCEAPIFKDTFWQEEDEIRAVFVLNKKHIVNNEIKIDNRDSYYYDLAIDENCISNIILGPELQEKEICELKNLKGKIDFTKLKNEKSIGTGVIRSSN